MIKQSLYSLLSKLDVFGQEVPRFNIRGREKINTPLGGLFTSLLMILVLFYGIAKLEHLLMHKNPAITMHEYQRKLDDTFPTTEDKFMMAFALLDDNMKHSIWNDRHFRWVLQSRDYTVEKKSKLNYPLHPCRKEEIARLYPAEVSSTDDQIWDLQEQGHLFCYERGMLPDRMRFYEKGYKDYATFSVNIYSCASKVTMFDGSVVGGPDAPCEFD